MTDPERPAANPPPKRGNGSIFAALATAGLFILHPSPQLAIIGVFALIHSLSVDRPGKAPTRSKSPRRIARTWPGTTLALPRF